MMLLEDKYIGLALAITSTMAIGTSFVITKKGLNEASERHGFEGDGFSYLKTPLWWAGIVTLIIGEAANFAAYAFAPAILVTPLGALSVLIGAVLGAYFLDEELGVLGKLGCAICLIGSVIIVLHAPPDKEITTVDEILHYALYPGKPYCSSSPTHIYIYRLHSVLPHGDCVFFSHDLPSSAQVRKKEPLDLYLDLLNSRFSISDVSEGIRHRSQTHFQWQQPVDTPIHLCICHHHRRLHPYSDELHQQSPLGFLDLDRQSDILCDIHHSHIMRVVHPFQRFQYCGFCQYYLSIVWVPDHFYRGLPTQSFSRRSERTRTPALQRPSRGKWYSNRWHILFADQAKHAIQKKLRSPSKEQQSDLYSERHWKYTKRGRGPNAEL